MQTSHSINTKHIPNRCQTIIIRTTSASYQPSYPWGPFYYRGLTLIRALISNMPGEVWDEIIYPFLNFNGCTVISSYIV